jgi:hypothetical protein
MLRTKCLREFDGASLEFVAKVFRLGRCGGGSVVAMTFRVLFAKKMPEADEFVEKVTC